MFARQHEVDVSVILITYNQSDLLALAIESLLRQDYKGNFEIIVSDDGSNCSLFSHHREVFNTAPIHIRYVWQQDQSVRCAAARNNGIRLARGRYLLFLDGDIVAARDLITRHVESHTREKLLVAGNRKWLGKLETICPDASGVSGWARKIVDGLDDVLVLDEKTNLRGQVEDQRRLSWRDSQHAWKVCFSANLSVERSGEVYFDEGFVGWGPEDWELSYRLCTLHGYTPVYNDQILGYHLEAPGSVWNIFRRDSHDEIVKYLRNCFYLYDKCPGVSVEDICFGLPRLKLDRQANQWRVVSRAEADPRELITLANRARGWLAANHIYP
jgi:glycosyltransferase involved in cell wall biosynthesis